MTESNPAIRLRNQVVTEVVRAIIALTFVLYAAIFVLLFTHRTVPGELWLGAGNASGALVALLVNSKNDAAPQQVVGVPGGEPVPVDTTPPEMPQDGPPDAGSVSPDPVDGPDAVPVDSVDDPKRKR